MHACTHANSLSLFDARAHTEQKLEEFMNTQTPQRHTWQGTQRHCDFVIKPQQQAHNAMQSTMPVSPQQSMTSRAEFLRQGQLCSQFGMNTPPAGQPMGYSTPRVRRMKSQRLGTQEIFAETRREISDAVGDATMMSQESTRLRPHTVDSGAVRPTLSGTLSAVSTVVARSTPDQAKPRGGSSMGDDSSRGSVSGHGTRPLIPPSYSASRPGTVQTARENGSHANPRMSKFACTMARQCGGSVWYKYGQSEFLNRPARRLRKRQAEKQDSMCYEDVYTSLHRGPALPVSWSPIPDPQIDGDAREAFRSAESSTGVPYHPPEESNVRIDSLLKGEIKNKDLAAAVCKVNSRRVQLLYHGASAFSPKNEAWVVPEDVRGVYRRCCFSLSPSSPCQCRM